MRLSHPFFAQDLPEVTLPWTFLGRSGHDLLLILGALTGVTLLAVLWAVFLRKRRRHSSQRRHHHSRELVATPAAGEPASAGGSSGKRRKWRRRRRMHRPRNPTLAETGGLPPVRAEKPPEPFP